MIELNQQPLTTWVSSVVFLLILLWNTNAVIFYSLAAAASLTFWICFFHFCFKQPHARPAHAQLLMAVLLWWSEKMVIVTVITAIVPFGSNSGETRRTHINLVTQWFLSPKSLHRCFPTATEHPSLLLLPPRFRVGAKTLEISKPSIIGDL